MIFNYFHKFAERSFVEAVNNLDSLSEFWLTTQNDFESNYTKANLAKPKIKDFNQKLIRLNGLFHKLKDNKSSIYSNAINVTIIENISDLMSDLPEDLVVSIKNLTKNLINQDKYAVINKARDAWLITKNKDYVLADVAQLYYYISKSYQNPREYLDVKSRVYIEDKIKEFINKIANNPSMSYSHLHLLSLDVNGLKTVNDYGVSRGHIDGNKLLLAFTYTLQSGQTTKLLQKLGIKIEVAAQTGDEYLVLFKSKKDLTPFYDLIEKMYLAELMRIKKIVVSRKIRKPDGTITDYKKEFGEIDIAGIIDYSSYELIQILKAKEVKVNKKMPFRITGSFGWSSFNEALNNLEFTQNADFLRLRNILMHEMIAISDKRSLEYKKEFKEFLKERGLAQLHALYTLRSDVSEIINLRRENLHLKRKKAIRNFFFPI